MFGSEMLIEEVLKVLKIDPEQCRMIFERIQKEAPEIMELVKSKSILVDMRLERLEDLQSGLARSLSVLTQAVLSIANSQQELLKSDTERRLAVTNGILEREQLPDPANYVKTVFASDGDIPQSPIPELTHEPASSPVMRVDYDTPFKKQLKQ